MSWGKFLLATMLCVGGALGSPITVTAVPGAVVSYQNPYGNAGCDIAVQAGFFSCHADTFVNSQTSNSAAVVYTGQFLVTDPNPTILVTCPSCNAPGAFITLPYTITGFGTNDNVNANIDFGGTPSYLTTHQNFFVTSGITASGSITGAFLYNQPTNLVFSIFANADGRNTSTIHSLISVQFGNPTISNQQFPTQTGTPVTGSVFLTSVPEPATPILITAGLGVLALMRRRFSVRQQ